MAEVPFSALIDARPLAAFDLGPTHPLRNTRLRLTFDLIQAYGLHDLPAARVLPTREATFEEMAVFHRSEYLRILRDAETGPSGPDLWPYGLGTGDNPLFPGMYAWSALVAGGSLLAMELVETGGLQVAFNFAGGLHHAAAARASGFCYVNDAAVIITHLVRRGRRVAYVDIDAHHGDGVQYAFDGTDQVLTISLHESGRSLFPGTGFVEEVGRGAGAGFSVNVPFLPGTDDEIFLWAFEEVVPPLVRAFRPDVLVTQLGVDTHRTDPLTNLSLTLRGYAEAIRRFRGLAPRWIALGGGGYDLANVPRAWTAAWAIMNGVEVPDALPPAFLVEFQRLGFTPTRLLDDPYPNQGPARDRAWRFAKEQVEWLRASVFPRHGL